jgi:hypothetical protein
VTNQDHPDAAGTHVSPSAYLETRGFKQDDDYAFLGAQPPGDWLDRFAGLMDTTRPCMALEQTSNGWRLFVNGIPSAKRYDFSGRRIGYAVILEQRPGSGNPDELQVGAERLVTSLLAGIVSPDEFKDASDAFDEQFSDDSWVAGMRKTRSAESGMEAERKVLNVLARLSRSAGGQDPAVRRVTESWLRDAHELDNHARFLAAARALLTGKGEAGDNVLVLNLVSEATNVPRPPAGASVNVLANLPPGKDGQPRQRVRPQRIEPVKPVKPVKPVPSKQEESATAGKAVASLSRRQRRQLAKQHKAERPRARGPLAWFRALLRRGRKPGTPST